MAQRDPAARPALRMVPDDRYADWESVYKDNVTWVYRTIYTRVGNRADAEDLTAEVFLAALRPLRLSASMAEVRAYLRASARTVLAAHWRETLGREVTTIEDNLAAPDSEEPSAPHRDGSTRCSMCCRTTTAGFWNYGSCKAIRSGRRRQRWV